MTYNIDLNGRKTWAARVKQIIFKRVWNYMNQPWNWKCTTIYMWTETETNWSGKAGLALRLKNMQHAWTYKGNKFISWTRKNTNVCRWEKVSIRNGTFQMFSLKGNAGIQNFQQKFEKKTLHGATYGQGLLINEIKKMGVNLLFLKIFTIPFWGTFTLLQWENDGFCNKNDNCKKKWSTVFLITLHGIRYCQGLWKKG